jgi:tetratricopeptide (TPR) repeat protein
MAETNRDEIAKLEALYAANPEGRVFTHLAEAFRKAGRLERAREILDDGLVRHGDYPSAHVVLGRVLLDAQDPDGAAHAFRRVLEMDRHNLIALRALGELAKNAGRPAEALHYYQELALVDPGNDELTRIAGELLVEAERAGDEAPVGHAWSAGPVETAFGASPDPAMEAGLGEAVEPEQRPVETEEPVPEELTGLERTHSPQETERPGDSVELESSASSAGFAEFEENLDSEADGVEVDEPPEPGDEEDVTYGLTNSLEVEGITALMSPGTETSKAAEPELDGPLAGARDVEVHEDIGPVDPTDWVPQERWDRFAQAAVDESGPDSEPGSEPSGEPAGDSDGIEEVEFADDAPEMAARADALPPADFDAEEIDPAEVGAGDEAGSIEPDDATAGIDVVSLEIDIVETVQLEDADLTPEEAEAIVAENLPAWVEEEPQPWGSTGEVVTETMAEVYASQGLTERAVEIYRQLRRLLPDDHRIEARLLELEDVLAMPTGGEAEEPDVQDREAWLEKVESAWTGGDGAVGADDETMYGWPSRREDEAPDARPIGAYFRAVLAWRPPQGPPEDVVPEYDGPDDATVASAPGFQDRTRGEPSGPEGGATDKSGPGDEPDELLLVDEIEMLERGATTGESLAGEGSVTAAFDEWFGPAPDEPAREATPEAGAQGAAAQAERAESDEDLEMFRTWLQSLKK